MANELDKYLQSSGFGAHVIGNLPDRKAELDAALDANQNAIAKLAAPKQS